MDRTGIHLRPAAPEDAPLLRHWDAQPHVVASDPHDDGNWEIELARSPAWRELLIGELSGRPVGFLQIIDPQREESHYWGEVGPGKRAIDIWIGEAADLNRGYGGQMMRQAMHRCFADPTVRSLLIDPLAENHAAIRFYRRLGFRFVEFRVFGADRCAVHVLDRSTYRTGSSR